MSEPDTVQRNNRRQLVLIALIALVSITLSYLLFFSARTGGVWGTTNQGEFVNPAISAADLGAVDAQGDAFATEGVWWLWVVGDGACNAACDDALDKMHALHILLHREADRLRRGFVVAQPGAVQPTVQDRLRASYPKLRHLQLDSELAPGAYILDPHGNLVLRYTLEQVGKPVQQDLKRLLKVSQIG